VSWDLSEKGKSNFVQAPAQLTSLFHGERQIVYGLVDYCTAATLRAKNGEIELSNMVSTQELSFTRGSILHTLTARAMIRDWYMWQHQPNLREHAKQSTRSNGSICREDGNYDKDALVHEIIKRKKKEEIIKLSIKYSLVTQFTSFGARSLFPASFLLFAFSSKLSGQWLLRRENLVR